VSQYLRDAVFTILNTAGALNTALGGRWYDTVPPEKAQMPYGVYTLDAPDLELYFGGIVAQTATLTFEFRGQLGQAGEGGAVTSGGSTASQDVGEFEELLYALMHERAVNVTNHDRGLFVCVQRGVPETTEQYHSMTSTYSLTATDF